MANAAVNYILQLATVSPSCTSAHVVGVAVGSQESSRVVLSQEEYHVASKGNFVADAVQLVFEGSYPVLILLSGGTGVTVVDEAHHDDLVGILSSRSFTHYDSPENIPTCFWFDFLE
jgi:hypothetical protein